MSRSAVAAQPAIAAEIRRRIARGVYRPGEKLPGERGLAVEFGVSRPTINRALGQLRMEGRIVVKWGDASYVGKVTPVRLDALDGYVTERDAEDDGRLVALVYRRVDGSLEHVPVAG